MLEFILLYLSMAAASAALGWTLGGFFIPSAQVESAPVVAEEEPESWWQTCAECGHHAYMGEGDEGKQLAQENEKCVRCGSYVVDETTLEPTQHNQHYRTQDDSDWRVVEGTVTNTGGGTLYRLTADQFGSGIEDTGIDWEVMADVLARRRELRPSDRGTWSAG